MTIREYEGSTIYYLEDSWQLAFPARRPGSSLPESLIHRMRDKAIAAEMVCEVPAPLSGGPDTQKKIPEEGK